MLLKIPKIPIYRKNLTGLGIVLLCVAVILIFFPIPYLPGFTANMLHDYCNGGHYANIENAPNCLDIQLVLNSIFVLSLMGLILVIVGWIFPFQMLRSWHERKKI